MRWLAVYGAILAATPTTVFAHEVYVLPSDVVVRAIHMPAFSEWNVLIANLNQFLLWGFIAAVVIFVVFSVSINRFLEHAFDAHFAKLPRFAPAISRVTVGLSFIAAAYFNALFGPELPLVDTFGMHAASARLGLAVVGAMIVAGFYTRIAALCALGLFVIEAFAHGQYLLTYATYAGELVVILILGAHTVAIHHRGRDLATAPRFMHRLKEQLTPYAFPLLRITFGTSLIYASLYAKVFHNNLALAVTDRYPDLVAFFGFEPHLLILGAAIIEILLGLFFVLGIEIRFASMFLLFWLSLSLWYFGEAVWPHLILIGIPIAFIFYGYDQYSLEGKLFKRYGREPVL